jgi:exopolysaccharide production protein ExoZ
MRLHNLDYLRGLAALGIMIYHYLSWTFGKFDASTVMGRIGVYGVSIFYVLSGLTLYVVYYHKMTLSIESIRAFFIKRFFRIFPLLWAVIAVTILLARAFPDPLKIFLNVTGLFGFVDWNGYIGTGVWSIGNELVFYFFFPLFVFLLKRGQYAFWALTTVLLIMYGYVAFEALVNYSTLNKGWALYVNPLNQVLLFLGGFLIGYFFEDREFRPVWSTFLILVGVILFIVYPVVGDRILLVVGWNRIAFTLLCFIICIGFYKLRVKNSLVDLCRF